MTLVTIATLHVSCVCMGGGGLHVKEKGRIEKERIEPIVKGCINMLHCIRSALFVCSFILLRSVHVCARARTPGYREL